MLESSLKESIGIFGDWHIGPLKHRFNILDVISLYSFFAWWATSYLSNIRFSYTVSSCPSPSLCTYYEQQMSYYSTKCYFSISFYAHFPSLPRRKWQKPASCHSYWPSSYTSATIQVHTRTFSLGSSMEQWHTAKLVVLVVVSPLNWCFPLSNVRIVFPNENKVWVKLWINKTSKVLFCVSYFYHRLSWFINNLCQIFPHPDVWRLGFERREVPQQPGPPAPSAPALHRLLLLSSTRIHQPLLSECRHDLLPHSQPWQWLHPRC